MARRTLDGSRGIVTGASSGIGRALAIELARRGAHLVLVARRAPELEQLAGELRASGRKAVAVPGDLTDPAVREAAIEAVRQRMGGLDLLVNAAGTTALGRFDRASSDRLRRIMELNFFAAGELIRTALPLLQSGRRPMIVNVASILAHRGIPQCSEYCASKFALRGLSESLRAELAGQGIDVLVVSPGTTQTDFFAHAIEPSQTRWPQQKGVPAELVARRTARAICQGKHEIIVNWRGWLLVWANRLAPRLVDKLMGHYG